MPTGPTPAMPSTLSPTGGQVPGLDYLRVNELTARATNALYLAVLGLLPCCLPVAIVALFIAIAVLRDVGAMGARGAEARSRAIWAICLAGLGMIEGIVILASTFGQSG